MGTDVWDVCSRVRLSSGGREMNAAARLALLLLPYFQPRTPDHGAMLSVFREVFPAHSVLPQRFVLGLLKSSTLTMKISYHRHPRKTNRLDYCTTVVVFGHALLYLQKKLFRVWKE